MKEVHVVTKKKQSIEGSIERMLMTTIIHWFGTPYRWVKHLLLHGGPRTRATREIQKTIWHDTAPAYQLVGARDPDCQYSG
jgi:hypothetical protein